MKRTILLTTALAVASLFIVSCDTNNEPNCPDVFTGEVTQTESDFLGKWTLESIIAEDEIDLTDDDTDNPSANIFDQYTVCQQDAIYEFKNDRSYTFQQGSTATDCSNQQTFNGSWKLNNDVLTFVANCGLQNINIDVNDDSTEFTAESNFNYIDVDNNEINSDVILTYKKQL